MDQWFIKSQATDHASSDQHKAAMLIHLRKAANQPIETHSPISLNLHSMDEATQKCNGKEREHGLTP